MMAMGQPPKMYMWYAAGPALFYFLVFSTEFRTGVAWKIAFEQQDQSTVWKIAKPGMYSSSILSNLSFDISDEGEKTGNDIRVPRVFTYVDQVVSEVVQNFVGVMGLQTKLRQTHGEDQPADQTLDKWSLLSTQKWELLNLSLIHI